MQRAGGAAMTHPITPPIELVAQWRHEWVYANPNLPSEPYHYIATQAAQWGADQELEACCEWLDRRLFGRDEIAELRAARRPKPPSLKEQAFAAFKNSPVDSDSEMRQLSADAELIIRRALEALPND